MRPLLKAVLITCAALSLSGYFKTLAIEPTHDGIVHVRADKYAHINKVEPLKELKSSLQQIGTTFVAEAPSSPVAGCGDNEYAHYVYMHESGCRLDAVNEIGACGIGQALPCSKLSSICPNWRTDYACQNSFFQTYAFSRYTSWAGAYQFWVSKSWW